MYTIYIAEHLETKKKYVGMTMQGLETRKAQHLRRGSPLAGYLLENPGSMSWSVLAQVSSREEAIELECYYIGFYKTITAGLNEIGRKPWNSGDKNVYTEEALVAMSNSAKGKTLAHDKQWDLNIKTAVQFSAGRKVLNKTTGQVYPSVGEAARELGVAHSTVKRILSGKRNSPTIKIEYFTKD